MIARGDTHSFVAAPSAFEAMKRIEHRIYAVDFLDARRVRDCSCMQARVCNFGANAKSSAWASDPVSDAINVGQDCRAVSSMQLHEQATHKPVHVFAQRPKEHGCLRSLDTSTQRAEVDDQ